MVIRSGWFGASTHSPVGEGGSTTVGSGGVDLTVRRIQVWGPVGVAPVGSVLTVAPGTAAAPAPLRQVTATVGPAIDISLGGRQPDQPLEVRVPLPGPPPEGGHAVLITAPSDGSEPYLIPGTYDPAAGTVTASVDHLSSFWPAFLDLGALGREVEKAVTQTLGISTARPDCAGKPATGPDGRRCQWTRTSRRVRGRWCGRA